MNKEAEFGIKHNLDFVNENLKGKTIKRFFDETATRVMIEFEDGSQGMIEVLSEEGGEKYLGIMPPTDFSEAYRESSGENVY